MQFHILFNYCDFYAKQQVPERSSGGGDVTQIMHDLQDSLERQNDLQDQLKYSEEELHIMRHKIDQLEAENESLSVQVSAYDVTPSATVTSCSMCG